jgi:V8-like Glu-specific endopeptidase
MKNLSKTTLSAAAVLALLPMLSFSGGNIGDKSIYGPDDRKDYFEASADMKLLFDSVVSFWKASSITGPGGAILKTVNFGERMNLCPGTKFMEQPIGAFCSGSLVGEDLVITAGHCVKTEEDCKNTKLVFGYAVKKAGSPAVTTLPASEVYTCGKIIKRFLGGEPGSVNPAGQALGPDYALIQLDRKVTGHKPLAINRGTTNLKKGDGIFVIGHPVGLPLKVAGGATVRDFSKVGYFVADLDTFGGNSGSPVFNTRTKLIEGILVRGDEDFIDSPAGCTTMATYAQTAGRGEDVTKISAISASIPKSGGRKAMEESAPEIRSVDSSSIQLEAPTKSVSFD